MIRYQELDNWLSQATAGLCDEAKTRIAPELESHVREAIANLHEQGIDEADAVRAAVTTLGDVKKARRAFRRIHLTEWEAKTVQSVNPYGTPVLPLPSSFVSLCRLLIALFLVGIIGAVIGADLWLLMRGAVGAIVVASWISPLVAQRLLKRPRAKRSPARIVLDRAIISFVVSIIFARPESWWRYVDIWQIVFEGYIRLNFATAFLFVGYRHLRLWRKMMLCDKSAGSYER